jgi:chitinase
MNHDKVRLYAEGFDLAQRSQVLVALRASIGMLGYLNYRGTPDINQRVTNVINDMSAQWDHGQAMWNAQTANQNQNRQTTVGDFWSEWVQDHYPWLIRHTTTWAQNPINTMRLYWDPRSGDEARIVMENLTSLEAQLVGLTIDTSRMN